MVFKCRAFVAYIPVIAAAAAERFGLRSDKSRMHDLCEKVIRFAEIRKKLVISVRFCMLCDRAANKVKAEALRSLVGIYFYFPAIHPFAFFLVLLLRFDEFYICLFKQSVWPPALVSVHKLSDKFQFVYSPALDCQQSVAAKSAIACLVK